MHIQKFYNELRRSGRKDGSGGLSPTTVRQIHRILRKALQYAIQMQYIDKNPADMVTVPKKGKFKPKVATVPDIPKYINAIVGTDYYIPVILAFELGLRRGEVLGVGWEHIDVEQGTVHICRTFYHEDGEYYFSTPKTENSDRVLLLSKQLMDVLADHKEKQLAFKELLGLDYQDMNLIYTRPNGEPIKPDALTHAWARLIKAADLAHIRFHDIRHTNATLLSQYNTHIRIMQGRLGHTDIRTTAGYTHPNIEMQRSATNALSGVIHGEQKPKDRK